MKSYRGLAFAVIMIAMATFLCGPAMAGEGKGLGKGDIREIRSSFRVDSQARALMNAISNNDLKKLTLNREFYNRQDDIFSDKVEAKGITNQKSSGRCWMFAGFNVMRPAVMERFKLDSFEFSENYLFFWDKLEKANMFLESVIETADRDIDDRTLQALLNNPVPDGGWWSYHVDLIEKYGVVPQCVSRETSHTSDTGRMNRVLNRMARADAAELRKMVSSGVGSDQIGSRKMEMMKDFYRVLVLHMGEPPEEFVWKVKNKDDEIIDKKFTPVSFYKEAVGIDLGDYVTIIDYPAYGYDRYYEIDYCRGIYDRPNMRFINLDIEELKKYSIRGIQEGEPVWFAADIGKENDVDEGVLAVDVYDYNTLLGIDHDLTKAELVQYRGGAPNHAMVFVGVDLEDNRPVKWRVENSWGTDRGDGGYWTMYDDWFGKYVFNVIVHKKHLPKSVLKLLDTEPEMIPAWDPMRAAFE
ncbi:MAG: C1 family peptidase [Candidatus Krumholzibacteriota bacterium]|nr:C1 family peptidase [Candidatus Krumholzibacteriota bacterium]